MKKALFASIVVFLLVTAAPLIADTPAYTITDLGTLGGTYSVAFAINDSGQIVGYSHIAVGTQISHGFLYDGGVMHDLNTLLGSALFPNDINNSGQIVGGSRIAANEIHAFFYDGMTVHDLGTLGARRSQATGINDNGQIVGYGYFGGHSEKAFLYEGGILHNLGTLGGGQSWASAINNNGQIVGEIDVDGAEYAFIYDANGVTYPGTFGGDMSYARDINDSGQVVGTALTAESPAPMHAFLYDGGVMYDLGTLRPGDSSTAYAINESGQIVGLTNAPGGPPWHVFLYDDGVMFDLNDLIPPGSGWVLYQAVDINSSGQIVGSGYIGGEYHAFLMTPVPESIQLYLDINTNKCSNILNVKSHDFLPVTILGTEGFDVNEIDVASVDLFGVGPIRSEYKDIATVLIDSGTCECAEKGSDGLMDLTLKFDRQAVVAALGEVVDGQEWMLELTGSLHDGAEIIGQDCVVIKKKGK